MEPTKRRTTRTTSTPSRASKTATTPYDAAEHLTTDERMAALLEAALEGELDAHLDEDERSSGNRKNGKIKKIVALSPQTKQRVTMYLPVLQAETMIR